MVQILPKKIDKAKVIEDLLKIDNKVGQVVPLKFNRGQLYFNKNKSGRNIILKHRQGGWSSSILADMYTDCITIPHTQCAVVSHETRSTQRLLDRVQFYHDTMEEPKPLLGAESRSEKTFPDLHSSIYIGTAGSRAFGRGDTIRKALLSELAFYEDAESILNAVEDAVPLTGELTIECYDDKTEILTRRGWLLFKDVVKTDLVLSKHNGRAYWSGIAGLVKGKAAELTYITGKSIDLAVTPNHNVWARKAGTILPFQMYQAKDLFNYSEWEFDSSLDWQGEEKSLFRLGDIDIPMDLWLEYTGFFLSEGWVEKYAVSVYQEGEYSQRFKEVTEQVASCLGKRLGVYANGYQFTIPGKELAQYLSAFTKPKMIPEYVLNLSKRQLAIFLKAYMMGDGEKKRNRCITKDIPLRDGIQEIGLKLGYRTTYLVKKAFGNHKESYPISFCSNMYPSVRQSRNQIGIRPYSGYVYCIQIPEDHLLMVRRNGKPVWSGNCTPNGEDNTFYEQWVRAREGKSPFKPFFFPWWWSEDYKISRGSEIALPEDRGELSYIGEELELIERAHLSEDQIRWRRWKIAEKQGLFWQEYPEDEVSCFITIGDPVFDQSILNMMASNCYEGKRHPEGWTYWIPPDTTGKTHYVLAADTSAGAPTGSFSAAVVVDDYWRVCATFQGRLEPLAFAGILDKMGRWYNIAQIAVERNFTGYAVLAVLAGGHTESGSIASTNYPNIYHQHDFLTGKVTPQLGWWTNEQTKEHMRTALRDKLSSLKIWDINLVRQLRGYRYIKMKPTAQTFDDMAMALQIACAVKKIEGGARGFMGKVPGYSW